MKHRLGCEYIGHFNVQTYLSPCSETVSEKQNWHIMEKNTLILDMSLFYK